MTTMNVTNNIAALNVHGKLKRAGRKEGKALERLSSGYRINRASDGAAELAISEKMRGQIRGLRMAQRNVEDAIALIRTAEGGLAVQNDMLQRMRELALASCNDVFGDLDRSKLADEYDALMEEINRISENAQYNNIELLNGDDVTSGRAASPLYQVRSMPYASPPAPLSSPAPARAASDIVSGEYFAISSGVTTSPGDMTWLGRGRTNWSNINSENLIWLRDKIVNDIAPSAVSDILNSLDCLGFLSGTNITVGLSQGDLLSGASGTAFAEIGGVTGTGKFGEDLRDTISLALQIDNDTLADAADANGVWEDEDAKQTLYSVIAHELVHAVMYVANGRGMADPEDRFPLWYVEGVATALTGSVGWLDSLSGSSTDTEIGALLSGLGDDTNAAGTYGAGNLAVMYLGYMANGGGDITAENILGGLNKVMGDNINGASLNKAFSTHVGMTVDEFEASVRAGGQEIGDFVRGLMTAIGGGSGALLGGLSNTNFDEWDVANSEAFLKLDPNYTSKENTYDDDVAMSGGGKTNPRAPLEPPPPPPDLPIIPDPPQLDPPTGVASFEIDGDVITITSSGVFDLLSEYSNHTIVIDPGLDVRLTQTGGGTRSEIYISCGEDTDLFLDGLNISNGADRNTIHFTGSGNTLNTIGDNTITRTSTGIPPGAPLIATQAAIINVTDGTELVVGEAAGHTGALNITVAADDPGRYDSKGGAIIGSDQFDKYGKITFASGEVNITSYARELTGAMIGGGNNGTAREPKPYLEGGEITILGGTLNVVNKGGQPNAAAIGGGSWNCGAGIIRIGGGVVNIDIDTTTDIQGAGIGTGLYTNNKDDSSSKIYITGGIVNSRLRSPSVEGAAIGGGGGSNGIEVNISGGTVTVSVIDTNSPNDVRAAAIGGGGTARYITSSYGDGAIVNISGGLVVVESGTIGGGLSSSNSRGEPGETHITGGTLVIDHDDIQGGVTDSGGTPLYRVSVLPDEIGFPFDPETEISFSVNGTGGYTWFTDPTPYNGGLYLYLPNSNPGDRTDITIYMDGMVYEGYAEIRADHSAVWVMEESRPGGPPEPPPSIDPPPAVPPSSVSPGNPARPGITGSTAGSEKDFVFQVGPNGGQIVTLNIPSVDSDSIGIGDTDISTLESARDALDDLDLAMEYVVGIRGKLGAMENRLEFTLSTLGATEENLTDAESGIRDADMAKEMMELTKSQMLRQVGVAMLAQANQLPETVLQLIR